MANRRGKSGSNDILLSWAAKSLPTELKRCMLLGKKSMTNLDSILKIRDITLLTKVPKVPKFHSIKVKGNFL